MDSDALNIAPAEWCDDAQVELEKAERFDTVRGLDTIGAMRARNAPLFAIDQAGAVVGWYVLELCQHPHGREAVVAAASGNLRGSNLTAVMSRSVELQAAGLADHIAAYTMRPGLIKKLSRLGWRADCVVMRKTIQCH